MSARTGLARALSKLGHCSRSQGVTLIKAGQVSLNGRVCRNPEQPVLLGQDVVQIQGQFVEAAESVYLMLNKPRGLVTTAHDEAGRATIYECLKDSGLPHLPAVGRLDKASEGLLLLTNDNRWAHGITAPESHLPKTYHVQVACPAAEVPLESLSRGVEDQGERLALLKVSILRTGEKNCWLEIVLDEGRNRHIRRVLEQHRIEVLRLMRVAIGGLELGPLAKGKWRKLTAAEVKALRAGC